MEWAVGGGGGVDVYVRGWKVPGVPPAALPALWTAAQRLGVRVHWHQEDEALYIDSPLAGRRVALPEPPAATGRAEFPGLAELAASLRRRLEGAGAVVLGRGDGNAPVVLHLDFRPGTEGAPATFRVEYVASPWPRARRLAEAIARAVGRLTGRPAAPVARGWTWRPRGEIRVTGGWDPQALTPGVLAEAIFLGVSQGCLPPRVPDLEPCPALSPGRRRRPGSPRGQEEDPPAREPLYTWTWYLGGGERVVNHTTSMGAAPSRSSPGEENARSSPGEKNARSGPGEKSPHSNPREKAPHANSREANPCSAPPAVPGLVPGAVPGLAPGAAPPGLPNSGVVAGTALLALPAPGPVPRSAPEEPGPPNRATIPPPRRPAPGSHRPGQGSPGSLRSGSGHPGARVNITYYRQPHVAKGGWVSEVPQSAPGTTAPGPAEAGQGSQSRARPSPGAQRAPIPAGGHRNTGSGWRGTGFAGSGPDRR